MKRDKLFRLSLAILFLWTSLALAAPAAMAASSTALPGSSLWEPYLQQSRIDLEKAASSPWETLKSFLPRSFGALVRQTASRYTSVLLFLTLTAVLGLLAGECTDGALLDLVAAGGCGVLLWGSLLEEAQKLAAEFAQNARRALILWKQCLNENYEHELPKKFNNNLQATIAYQPYHDFKEASTAFIEKRVPEYDEQ